MQKPEQIRQYFHSENAKRLQALLENASDIDYVSNLIEIRNVT